MLRLLTDRGHALGNSQADLSMNEYPIILSGDKGCLV